ncbi:MAG: HU domain-containing protein [Bacteroidia bacterium]
MQKVDKHISELLYEHDCVIVPDFGGFVANYAPAKIHPTQHTFTPPSKNIVFNKNLKNNDGLLANHIATTDNSNYQDALKYINHFVDFSYAQLKKGVKVNIDDVGVLFLDVERNIQFKPSTTNYLLDAFGMSQFQSPAIKRDTATKRLEKEFKDRDAIPVEKKKRNRKRYVALAIAAPLVFAMIWIPLKTDLLKNINYANINPFASKEIKKPEPKINPKTTVVLPLTNNNDTTTASKLTTPPQPVTTMVEPVKADTTAVAKVKNLNLNFKFHLVAGCFQIEENAVNFVTSLKQQNIPAAIIGKNNKGLYVVSCADFATRKEAMNELENLRKLQPNTWLYKN